MVGRGEQGGLLYAYVINAKALFPVVVVKGILRSHSNDSKRQLNKSKRKKLSFNKKTTKLSISYQEILTACVNLTKKSYE